MLKKIYMLLVFLACAAYSGAQVKTVTNVQQVWTGYLNQTRFSERWGAWFDVQFRTRDDFFEDISAFMIRPGITYYLGDATKLTAGYAYILSLPPGSQKVEQPENRLWQQVQWHTKYSRLRTMQMIRLEERFRRRLLNDSTLGSGNDFNWRIRYNFLLQLPLTKKGTGRGGLSFIANDEIHINFGKEIIHNYFDQNRFFLGLAYHVNQSDNLQFGYTNVFQQLPSGNRFRSINGARILYFHNLDLRTNRKDAKTQRKP